MSIAHEIIAIAAKPKRKLYLGKKDIRIGPVEGEKVHAWILYQNHKKEIKLYEIFFIHPNDVTKPVDTKKYFVVDRVVHGDTYRRRRQVWFNSDLIAAYPYKYKSLIEKFAEKHIGELDAHTPKYVTESYVNKYKRLEEKNKTVIIFTGFSASDKKRLTDLAKQKGFRVTTSVSQKTGLLVLGDNAGPSKMTKARAWSIPMVEGEKGFLNFLETGEIDVTM